MLNADRVFCDVLEFEERQRYGLRPMTVSVTGSICAIELGWLSGWSGKDKLDFLLRILKRIAARIPLETCSPGWNACAPYCNRALCT